MTGIFISITLSKKALLPEPVLKPLDIQDRKIIKAMKDKAWFTMFKFYGTMYIGIGYIYYKYVNKYPEHSVSYHQMNRRDFMVVFEIFALIFGLIFLYFLIRDYKRMIPKLTKELKSNEKTCQYFSAIKYEDPIFKKHLIYYPGRDSYFIALEKLEFDVLENGQELYLETGSVTGEIFLMQSKTHKFETAEEFSFKE